MRILLIKPPYTRIRGSGQTPYFPLGLGYLAAMLGGKVEEIKIYNAENPLNSQEKYRMDQDAVFKMRAQSYQRYLATLRDDHQPAWQEILQTLKAFKPHLVGISVLTVELGSALKVSQLCKEYNKDCLIAWGGPHPTFEPDESIRYKDVDFLIRGEGEITLKELIEALQAEGKELGSITGLSYKANGEVIHTGSRELIKDLDTLPLPAKHLSLYPERYLPKAMGSLITSRGCPWPCTFCSAKTFWQKKTRYRSSKSLIQEIKKIQRDHHINEFLFWDDAFTVSRDIVSRYCHKIIQEGLKVCWRTATRADLLDDELLKLMRKAGCIHLDIGVESGSERILKLIRKELEPAQVKQAFDLIKKNGMTAGAFFMAGFPQETRGDLRKTFSLIKEIKAVNIAFNILDPLPGSEILKTAREMGMVPEKVDWSTFPFWPLNHFVKEVSKEEFGSLAQEMEAWVDRYNKRWRNLIQRARPVLLHRLTRSLRGYKLVRDKNIM